MRSDKQKFLKQRLAGALFLSRSSRATIGNLNLPVLFAGAQGTFVGLDQINLGPIPRELIGAGTVNVTLRVNNQPANAIQICIAGASPANLLVIGRLIATKPSKIRGAKRSIAPRPS